MLIREISVIDYPVCVFTDAHCNINNVRKLQLFYPNKLLVSLGDITNLFCKTDEPFNKISIDFFIRNNIPTIDSNHESFLVAAEEGDKFTLERVIGKTSSPNLTKEHLNYLKSLPRGLKLNLPDGTNYLCFHHRPKDIWGFPPQRTTKAEFLNIYPFDSKTRAILKGHEHCNYILDYSGLSVKLICVGRLSSDGDYALITEKGLEFKKI